MGPQRKKVSTTTRKGKAPQSFSDDDSSPSDDDVDASDNDANSNEDFDSDFEVDEPGSPRIVVIKRKVPLTPNQRPKKRTSMPTPKQGILKDNKRRRSLIAKVRKASIHGDLCALKYQTSDCNANEVAHALKRATAYNDTNTMDSFAYNWGEEPNGINLDSRRNASICEVLLSMRLNNSPAPKADTTLHRIMDAGGFAVLPVVEQLRLIYAFGLKNAERAEGDKIRFDDKFEMPEDGWPSELLPLDIPTSHTITRGHPVRVEHTANEWVTIGRPSHHSHPYRKFGLIKTHVHPYFRVADAHTKNLEPRSFWTKKQRIAAQLVSDIMELWLEPPPDEFVERAMRKREEQANLLNNKKAEKTLARANKNGEAGPSNHR